MLAWIIARIDTGQSGFFTQDRIGRHGRPFRIRKIRTMKPVAGFITTVTTDKDPRITRIGRVLRRMKIDELPQLYNVLIGDMSIVGPRPEVRSYVDLLSDDDRVILTVRPGITGPASLKYRDEAALLARVADPEQYNREVLYPDKIRINRAYVQNLSLIADAGYVWQTFKIALFGNSKGRRSGE